MIGSKWCGKPVLKICNSTGKIAITETQTDTDQRTSDYVGRVLRVNSKNDYYNNKMDKLFVHHTSTSLVIRCFLIILTERTKFGYVWNIFSTPPLLIGLKGISFI